MESDGLKETYPNVETILKREKNYLRSTVSQEHLNSLSILYIESDALNHVNYDEVMDTFATIKARRKL